MDFFSNYLNRMREEMTLRNLSPRTVKIYTHGVREYFRFLGGDLSIDVSRPDNTQIRNFLLYQKEKGNAPQTINLYLKAIKFFYREIIQSSEQINIHYAARPGKLPAILSRNEISKLLHATRNIKHKLLIGLAYGAGLRVSEAVSVRVRDIDLERFIVTVRSGKGDKDRITVFPEKLKNDFTRFTLGRNGDEFVFESQRGGKLAARTAQQIFQNALRIAGIQTIASFHSLRHSFATHLIENGTSVFYIQELLGHKNIKTTMRYTRLTTPALRNIKSPL